MSNVTDWGGIVLGGLGLLVAGSAEWRARRADKAAAAASADAEAARQQAARAGQRAEEAHTILLREHARHEADIEAPAIADRWIRQLEQATADAERAKRDHGQLSFPVTTIAERKAVELLRARQDELFIVEITISNQQAHVGMWTLSSRIRQGR